MSDDNKMLGFYSVVSGNEIHIIDTDPFSLSRGGGLTDVSLIEKYKMSEEVYEKRAGTMREFIREQRKKDPNFKLTPKMGPGMGKADSGDVTVTTQLPPGVESVAGMEVGMRCELTPGARRGTVRFVGEIPEIKAGGYWVRRHHDYTLHRYILVYLYIVVVIVVIICVLLYPKVFVYIYIYVYTDKY